MARQRGVIQFTGKLGQTVGMKNPYNTDQYLREYISDVNNPRTAAQAAQRMRMTPAVNFYRQLGYIINHAYQGTRYKAPSQRRFMSDALKDTTLLIPFQNKGDQRFVPGNYIISSGTLPGVLVTGITDPNNIATTLQAEDIGTTIGTLSEEIYENNAGFLYGDKLTFIWVTEGLDGQTGYQLFSAQMVLDNTNQTTLTDYLTTNKITFAATNNQLVLRPQVGFNIEGDPVEIVAAAVIQSRVPASSSGDWQRSNSRFYMADSLLNTWMTAGRFNEALASYQDEGASAVNSDWYLNFGTYESRGVTGDNTTDDVLFNIAQITLPESGSNPAITLSNVAAISNGQVSNVILSSESVGSTTRNVYTKIAQNTITPSTTVPLVLPRLLDKGYGVIYENMLTQYGITIQTNEGGDPGEDRP